jgi:cytochrome c oxidase subunit II
MNPQHIFGHVFGIEAVIAAIVFVLVCIAMIAAIAISRHRRRRDKEPSRKEEHSALELAYALVVAGVVAFVVALSFHSNAQEHADAQSGATKIDINGFQWCWQFSYPDRSRTVTGTCQGERVPTMVVPVGQEITLSIRSSDVIHSWWVPALRYKLDAFPDHTNSVTIKLDKAGRWAGRCAEFCGHRHAFMGFFLKAVPRQQFQQWLAGSAA